MSRLIGWFVLNPVAANLLMWVLVVGGLMALPMIRQEEFPSIETDVVSIQVPYLGAAPEEAEEAVCIRIEEAIDGTEGIDRMTSRAVEGACVVTVELVTGADTNWALGELESKVDAIDTFPAETEKPIVSLLRIRQDVLKVAIAGEKDERTLKRLGQSLRDEIAALDGVSQVDLQYVRPYEISIEISEHALRRHGLTLSQVAEAVRRSSLDMPGGSLKTQGGEILLRSKGQAYSGAEFEDVVVLTRADGTSVTVGEIGRAVDGFRDDDMRAYFNGEPAVMVLVSQVGDEDILEIAEKVKDHVAQAQERMPDGVTLTIWQDSSEELRQRVFTLLGSAGGGLVMVLLVLSLFLRFRLAMWVAAGIPISLLGALLLFPAFDLTISTLAVMAFILVLGIVVDDAIVVGERVHAYEQTTADRNEAAIQGTREVAIPVTFGVLTTITAFSPLVLVPGRMGQFFAALGGTVIIALVFSLIEAQLILPAHLARRSTRGDDGNGRWARFQDRLGRGLERFANGPYHRALERVLEWRYLALAAGVGVLMLALAVVASGRVIFQFFPSIAGDRVHATLTLPNGTPVEVTQRAVQQIEAAANQLRSELDAERAPGDGSAVRFVHSSIGTHIERDGPPDPFTSGGGAHLGEVALQLIPAPERSLTTDEVARRWRELTPPIPDAVELTFEASAFGIGKAIDIQLSGRDVEELRSAAAALRADLASYDGVADISDSFRAGKREVKLSILPEAKPLGLTQIDLARQVREAFYGAEAQRIQRGIDDVRVMVRFPEEERRSLSDLEDMRIRTRDGTEIPFASVARAELGRGYAMIRRSDRQRVVNVTADIDRAVTTPEEVLASIRQTRLPAILEAHPGVSLSLEGEQRERLKAVSGLFRGLGMALLCIYVVLAIPLRSYAQPLLIMSAIPFGAVGAILGHLIMGWDLVFFSMLGIVALSGVVVNDSLVLVDYVNRKRAEGMHYMEAVHAAGVVRFRAIMLTSVTTFVGLLPLIFNRNPNTFFVVPIAISLAFGVLAATGITLFLVPSAYVIMEDILKLWSGEPAQTESPGEVVHLRGAR